MSRGEVGAACERQLPGSPAVRGQLLDHLDVPRNAWPMHGTTFLEKVGLRIAWQKGVWCWSAADSLEAAIRVSDAEITRRTREQGFKALGVWITFDGHFTRELSER